jgi:aryl-alcohol dehydrogenase-like predicted oxidoreductase
VYSNGKSEEILGKAIKEHNLPRDEIVVLTKVQPLLLSTCTSLHMTSWCSFTGLSRGLVVRTAKIWTKSGS